MESSLVLVGVIVLVALAFDFINGFHDAANSIATIVSTRVLTAVLGGGLGGIFQLQRGVSVWDGGGENGGAGMVHLEHVTPWVILAGLVGAITWDLITWWFGLPTSSSHALLGGYAGAAMAHVAHLKGIQHCFEALIVSGWSLTLIFIVVAPLIGFVLAMLLMVAVYWLFRDFNPKRMDQYFRRLQLLSSAALSVSHGTNDAQKTMGIITAVLVSSKHLAVFEVPFWVLMASYTVIALGTLSGGWRIIHTMGARLTKLKPRGGFCAETAAAISIIFAAHFMHPAPPVSTTHVTAGAIAGVGSIQRFKAVRWGIAANIAWAWVLTIPASALVGWISLLVFHLFVPEL